MADNPYLKLADQDIAAGIPPVASAANDNPYMEFAKQDMELSRERLKGVLDVVSPVNPDQAAEALKLSRSSGLPEQTVQDNLDQVRRQERVRLLNVQRVMADSPVLARQLLDPNFAKIAQDDVEHTSAIESAVRYLVSAPGQRNTLMGDLGAGVYEANRGAAGVFRAGAELFAPLLDPLAGTILPENPLRRVAAGFEEIGLKSKQTSLGLSPPTDGTWAGGVSSGVKSLSQNLLGLPMAFMPGGQGAYLSMMAGTAGGQAYLDAREAGLTPIQSLPFAASQAVIEYATEKLPVHQLLGDVKAGAPVWKMLAHQMALEIPGEQVATVLQDLNEWAVLHPERPFSDYLAERPNAALQTAIATVIGVGGNVAVTKGVESVMGNAAIQDQEAQRANQMFGLLTSLNEMAGASKVRERDVDTFEGFMQSVEQEAGPVNTLYIDPKTLVETLQAAGANVRQVAESLPSLSSLDESLRTGTLIAIPVSEFAARIAGTDYAQALMPHLQGDPNGMSKVQADEYMQTHGEQLKAEVEKALAEKQGDETFKSSMEKVKADVAEQIKQTQRFTNDVTDAYATLMSTFYGVMGARLGVTPEQMASQYPIKITAQAINGGEQYDQAGNLKTDTPQFKNWFKESKVVDKAGKPLVVYHTGNFDADEIISGAEKQRRSGAKYPVGNEGTYFSADPVYSAKYGKGEGATMYPVYLSLQNPFVIGDEKQLTRMEKLKQLVLGKRKLPRNFSSVSQLMDSMYITPQYKAELIALGYDGIINKPYNEIVTFEPTQIKSAIGNNGEYDPNNPNILFQQEEKTPEFKQWQDDLPIVHDGGNDYEGGPAIFEAFHGTTHPNIEVFKRTGNPEGYLGEGPYFSTSAEDASANYAGVGPDLTVRIEREAEQIRDSFDEDDYAAQEILQDYFDANNIETEITDENIEELKDEYRDKAVDHAATARLKGETEGLMMPVLVKLKNPADTTGKSDDLTYEVEYDDEGDVVSETGSLLDWVEATRTIAGQYGFDADEYISAMFENGDSIGMDEIFRLAQKHLTEAYDDNGNMLMGGAIFREIAEEAGFDGVIMDADLAFGSGRRGFGGTRVPSMAGVEDGTLHIVPFNSNAVKSVFNKSPTENPNILKQGEDTARGKIAFAPDITQQASVITLLNAANLSTFLHESGHFFLEVTADIARRDDAPQEIRDDMKAVLKWFGVPSLATWTHMSVEEKRPYHEQFARGFEAYLFEGNSPNLELTGVFQRFRAWLVNIYKQITGLNVTLDDEIRGVFDRMVASTESIQQAEAARSYAPMFKTKPAFMSDEEWKAYQLTDIEATQNAVSELEKRSLRDMQWLTNAKSRILKALQKDAAEKRKDVRREVEAEVMAEPVYRTAAFLKRGTLDGVPVDGPHKLAIPEIEELYKDSPILGMIKKELGFGKYGMLGTENAIYPQQVADMMGFSSVDHMIRSLLESPDAREVIDQRTNERMLERYGDINSPEALSRAADEAIHNDARAKFVATEANALAKATGRPRVLASAAKQFASDLIARLKIRDIRPGQYTASAARAAKNAAKPGIDLVEAATEKRNQLINTYAAKEAFNAQDEVIKAVRYLRKFDNKNIYKVMHPDYIEQIHALLERFDLRSSTSLKAIDKRRALVDWVKSEQAKGNEPIVPQELLDEAYRISYKEMTLEDFRGLIDAVRNIEHLGRLKDKLLKIQDQREFRAVATQAAETIRENATGDIQQQLEKKGVKDAVVGGGREVLAWHRKFSSLIRQMDGFKDGGFLWQTLTRPMNEAGTQEASMREQATVKLAALYKGLGKVNLNQKVFIPEIGGSLSLEGRLAIALNMGNETNMRRVMEGERWNAGQVNAVVGTLTREQWNFVQGVWDMLNSYWPEIAAKERRMTGIVPEKVQARPFVVTLADGTQVTMEGGYYPIKYNSDRSSKAEADTAAEVLKQMERGLYARAQTARGHIESRMESVGRPMRYDLGVIDQHLNQVIHDLSWHEYLVDANRLLRADPIDNAIREHYGPEVLRTMRGMLEDIAIGELPAQGTVENMVRWVRGGSSIAAMGWSVMTAVQQPTGLAQSMVRIGPKWVAMGISRWLRDAASMESTVGWINERSEFMRLRNKTMQREISEIRNTMYKGATMTAVEGSFFYLIGKAQQIADVPTWIGMYEKSMAEGADEAKAIALADQAVLDSQGGGQIKDLSKIQRGGEWQKLWTNFYSYFNVTYNMIAESIAETRLVGPSRLPLLAVDVLMLTVVPATLGFLIKSALKGGDDDEEKFAKKLVAENVSYLLGLMVGTREIGAAVAGTMGYEGPAGARFFADIGKFATQVSQGEADEAFWRSANELGGVLFHYPASQIDRTVRGILALQDGTTENPLAPLVGPPPKN